MASEYSPRSRDAVLKQAYFGLNLLSFCFNWDNYALLPVLYPRITSPYFANDSAITYGWVGASFAIAAAFGSLVFGVWADKRGAREPLIIAQIIMMGGDILTYLRLNSVWNILLGRIVSGIGAGSKTCCLWYLAKTTTGNERGKMIGNWYAVGMLGMVLAPAMAALSGTFPTPETGSALSINAYNAPALSSLLLHVIAVYIVWRWVHNPPAQEDELYTPIGAAEVGETLAEPPPDMAGHGLRQRDAHGGGGPPWGCFILVACQFLMVTGISSFETVVVPLFGSRFSSPAWVTGLVFAGIGVVVLISAIVSGALNEGLKWTERKVEVIGLVMFVIGCVMSFEYPNSSVSLLLFLEIMSTILVSAGFTMAFCMQPSLFSKLIINHQGGRLIPKMGHYMSWLSIAGSAAKISGPLIIGYGLAISNDLGTSINVLVSVIIGLAGLAGLMFALGWTGLIVSEADEHANAGVIPEDQKYLSPSGDVLRNDGTVDVRMSFAEAARTMSMGQAALAQAIGE